MGVIVAAAGTMSPRALTTTIWAMGSLKHKPTLSAARAMAHHALAVVPILDERETANVAWACARLQERCTLFHAFVAVAICM